MSEHATDRTGERDAVEEEQEIQAEKEAQVLRREGVEQELMQDDASEVGEQVDDVEEDDPA